MTGKDCVAIASDLRYGIQLQTVGMNFPKVFEMGPKLYIGLAGLATDIQVHFYDYLLRSMRMKIWSAIALEQLVINGNGVLCCVIEMKKSRHHSFFCSLDGP